MIAICAGMFRAGSTWQFLVAGRLCELAGRPFENAGFLEDDRLAARLAVGFDPATNVVFKTHAASDRLQPLVAAGAVVLYCYRDLRDVVYSMAHKVMGGFREAVDDFRIIDKCLANDAFWRRQPGVLVQRYEDLVTDPAQAVEGIATRLGFPVGPPVAADVAARFSLEENRRHTAQLAEGLRTGGVNLADRSNAFHHDSKTLLHWNHLRDGRVGGWRETATPEEIAILLDRCGPWLIDRGYEADTSWAAPLRRAG